MGETAGVERGATTARAAFAMACAAGTAKDGAASVDRQSAIGKRIGGYVRRRLRRSKLDTQEQRRKMTTRLLRLFFSFSLPRRTIISGRHDYKSDFGGRWRQGQNIYRAIVCPYRPARAHPARGKDTP